MEKLGIYIHIPFCQGKCHYCDFNSTTQLSNVNPYIQRLIQDIEMFDSSGYTVDSIFFGGGTPSILASSKIEEILKMIKNQFILTNDCEITIECNPGTVDEEKLQTYFNVGINRLSFGVQAFQEHHLKRLGRIHSFQQLVDNYQKARSIGFDNINLDIIFGLPYQTMEELKETLEEFVRLKPEHLSVYALTIEESTPFFQMSQKDSGFIVEDEMYDEMYTCIRDYLKTKQYMQYEVSNFAKEGRLSRHNDKYWSCVPYVGFGVSSASYLNDKRIINCRDIQHYIDRENNHSFIESELQLSLQNQMDEFMYLGLRRNCGVSDLEFQHRFGDSFFQIYSKQIDRLVEQKWIHKVEDRIFIDETYTFVNNKILAEFLRDEEI